jgi:hypothetical protein
MSVARVFARCNGGHYFVGHTCPFDGWSSEETREIARAAAHLGEQGKRPSLEDLALEGLSDGALARACIAEFHSQEAAVEAIEPSTVVIEGIAYPLHKAPPGVK